MQLRSHAHAGRPRRRKKAAARGAKPKAKPLAERADRYQLYQKSVQDPDGDVQRVRRMYERLYGGTPRLLREDFCGTAAFAASWVKMHRDNRAWAVDLDPEPLAWGREHNLGKLRPEQLRRVTLIEGDVRTARSPKVDVLVAFNFSFFLFKRRQELLAYFRRAWANLKPRGMFAIDVYGGPESMEPREEKRRVGGFTYVWDQYRYDPITHDATCHIHFHFRDGSRLRRAFSYHWRLWTVAELRELLEEAGFATTTVYWEGTIQETLEPNGVWRPREHADEDPSWVAYLVAGKTAPR